MKVSMTAMVGLVVVLCAFWMSHAEAGHGGGRVAAPRPPRGGGRAPAPKPHVAAPRAKAPHAAKPAAAKAAQKKQRHNAAAKAKHEEKKKHEELTRKHDEKKKREELARKHDEKKEHEELAKKAEEKKKREELARKHEEKKKREEHARKAEKKKPAGGAVDHESIAMLRAAHQKLHEADHDYNGHRVRSIEHVRSALGHLGSSASGGGRSGSGRLPQSVSDAIMREARGSLESIRARLSAGGTAFQGHGPAHGAVEGAIREIDTALAIR